MHKYKIVFTKPAQKEYSYLYKTNKALFWRIRTAMHSLAENPTQGKPMKLDMKGKWSYRIGMYRIIYSIYHNILTIYILDIGHRHDIYR